MGSKSRSKGKAGEREAAQAIQAAFGVSSRRGVQHKGTPDSPDVITELPFHIEVKRVEALRLRQAVAQAQEQAGEHIPIVLHRWNRGPWLLILKLEDVMRFAKALRGVDGEDETR